MKGVEDTAGSRPARRISSGRSEPIIVLKVTIARMLAPTAVAIAIGATVSPANQPLAKPIKPEHLVSTVRNRVERTRSMRFYMERDSLTWLLNHTHLMHNLSREIQRAERVGRPVCFAMIDLDHFKGVNDTYGHLTGDRVLKNLSRHLQDALRKTDIIGRWGGEEFGVVLFNVDLDGAAKVMDKVREEFSRMEQDSGSSQFAVTFSCGIAAYPKYDGPGPISEAADRALYSAKEGGRNQIATL